MRSPVPDARTEAAVLTVRIFTDRRSGRYPDRAVSASAEARLRQQMNANVGSPVIPTIENPIEDGWTLPAGWYADEGVWSLARERIFASTWQYAGRSEQVREPRSFFASQAGHIPVALVRDREGVLRGFVNVCRHRGHPVVAGEGCRETLQCPYHAWTYDLDGSLRRAPRAEREPGFDPAGLSLRPVSVDTWGPFVFVNPDPDAAPLAEGRGGLPELVAQRGLDLGTLRSHSPHAWEIKSTW
jgi:choline monooxygenase